MIIMIQTKRLQVVYEDYVTDPKLTIVSFIGAEADIIDIKENTVVSNGYVCIDVKYKVLDMDPTIIYWTKRDEYKLESTNAVSKFVTKINNIPLYVLLTGEQQKMKNIPITIKPILQNTYGTSEPIKYFGTVIASPLHDYSSVINMYTNKCTYDMSKLTCKKTLFDKDVIELSYNRVLKALKNNYIKYVTSSVSVTDTADIKAQQNKGYIIDGRLLTISNIPNGIIICAEKRSSPFDVMYIPIKTFRIKQTDIDNLRYFLYREYENYENWIKLT